MSQTCDKKIITKYLYVVKTTVYFCCASHIGKVLERPRKHLSNNVWKKKSQGNILKSGSHYPAILSKKGKGKGEHYK